MTCSTAKQTAKNVASALVRRHDTIGDHKCYGTDVIGDDTNGNILLFILMINSMCNLTNMVGQCAKCIYIKNRIYVLNSNCQSLKTHTCINVFLDQICVMTMSIVIKL